jgi:hypothetical protein
MWGGGRGPERAVQTVQKALLFALAVVVVGSTFVVVGSLGL